VTRTAPSAQKLLDETKHQLECAPTTAAPALVSLASYLRTLKREQSPREWDATVEECRTHSLRKLLHQDPLTARAYARPRGYQGDAELLDMIYASDYRPFCSVPVTELGDAIFRHTIQCKAPSAVRIRRDFLATQIDEACESIPSAHILSVACGHLRETEFSDSVQSRAFGRFVGLDQDPDSLKIVTQTCGALGVEAVRGSVKTLLSGSLASNKFDFIYSAGLYDYLEERLAQRLTEKLFEMLGPRGRLLIANYLPDLEDVGYMEIYADWRLIYRDAAAMRRLTETIAAPIASVRIFPDTSQTVLYLELHAS
jgi:extracellular factor (EF) 3-hydroxypalmitic acid methyl ester biosynthesis protein